MVQPAQVRAISPAMADTTDTAQMRSVVAQFTALDGPRVDHDATVARESSSSSCGLENDLQLLVRTQSGTLAVDGLRADDDVAALVAAVEAKAMVPRAHSWLEFGGKRLDAGRSLASYGLRASNVVHLAARGRGGGLGRSPKILPPQRPASDDVQSAVEHGEPSAAEESPAFRPPVPRESAQSVTEAAVAADMAPAPSTASAGGAPSPSEAIEMPPMNDAALRATSEKLVLPPALDGKLVAHDYSQLWLEKRTAHLKGTREWALDEIGVWLDTPDTPQLFWLMGGGGTGKSVLTAALHERVFERVIAWHYCRHDNPQASASAALLRSLAAMLCHRLPGYEAALAELPAETVTDPKELFAALFEAPLGKVDKPEKPLLVIVDALDELPKEYQKSLLLVIAGQLAQLPPWLKLFVTSREEPQIKAALSKFDPKELRATDARSQADVAIYLRKTASERVENELSMVDLEADIKRTFSIDMGGRMAELQSHVDKSREIYDNARTMLKADEGFAELLAIEELRPEITQESDDFSTVYKQAREAQKVLTAKVASEWQADASRRLGTKWKEVGSDKPIFGTEISDAQLAEKLLTKKRDEASLELSVEELGERHLPLASFIKIGEEYMEPSVIQHPVEGSALEWVEFADDPGIKGEPRSREKMKNDYKGHAHHLKDLARLTLRFTHPAKLVHAIEQLKALGFRIVSCKNKYKNPTPMGYSDINLVVELTLESNVKYLCELQLNLQKMIDAKKEAHPPYEVIRTELPTLCMGTAVDANVLEDYITRRLNNSALDAAVAVLSQKADGLFLYAHLLAQHLASVQKGGGQIDFASLNALPAGLGEVYTINFQRAFPRGKEDPAWLEAKPFIQLVAAAREPITEAMAAALLAWDPAQQQRVLEATALLFPVRDGMVYVFHKTVVDWLTGEIAEGSSVKESSDVFQVRRADGHATFAQGFVAWLGSKTDGDTAKYWLKHGVAHLCRAKGRAAEAAAIYASNLALLRQRLDTGLLATVAKDYLELCKCEDVALKEATEMRRFVGKYTDVLQKERGAAVLQLAAQQPDSSAVFKAWSGARSELARTLVWRNKPQQADPCIATLVHPSSVKAVAVSKMRIVGASGKSVFVYDAETEELLQEFEGESEATSVAIAEQADGTGLIAAGYKSGLLKVWNADTLELKTEQQNAHSDYIRSVAFSPDGKTIVSGCDDCMIKVWSSDTLELKATKESAHSHWVMSVAFSPDGKTIVSGSRDQMIKVWSSDTLELQVEQQSAHSDTISSVNYAPDGKTIISGSRDQTIKVWSADTLELQVEQQNAHSDTISSVNYAPDGKTIVSASYDGMIKVWSADTLELQAEKQNAHNTYILSVTQRGSRQLAVWRTDRYQACAPECHTLIVPALQADTIVLPSGA